MREMAKVILVIICVLFIISICSLSYFNKTVGSSIICIYDMQTFLAMNYNELIIDRFEGDFAVCEDENLNMVNIYKTLIPIDAPEGAVLKITDGNIEYDEKETLRRKEEISERVEMLFNKYKT